MNTWVIMQARVGSTRLPAKVLMKIQGKTMLEHDIERCLRIKRSQGIVIATTTEPEAADIINVCRLFPEEKVRFFQGSVEDVLSRYYESSLMVEARTIVRITSDCPLLDPLLVNEMIGVFQTKSRQGEPLDYLCNNMPPTFPHGLDAEIFTFDALQRAHQEARLPREREHVTPYIRNHPEIFRLENFLQETDQSRLRWTLDYPEDFEFIKTVYDRLYPVNPEFSRFDVLSFLTKHPEINLINQNRCQR
jgi:spore coat polysaccharide biosynthesis protein SpsF